MPVSASDVIGDESCDVSLDVGKILFSVYVMVTMFLVGFELF